MDYHKRFTVDRHERFTASDDALFSSKPFIIRLIRPLSPRGTCRPLTGDCRLPSQHTVVAIDCHCDHQTPNPTPAPPLTTRTFWRPAAGRGDLLAQLVVS